jgi:hypothetical protein
MGVLRSILAVVAGFIAVVVLSTGTDLALESSGLFPPPAQQLNRPEVLAIALLYRCVFTIIGGWIAARLAPSRPMRHALILGAIGTAAAIAGCLIMWKLGQQWYAIALVLTAIPCTWLGGWIRGRAA